jgi:predicted outer membrane repeat protein
MRSGWKRETQRASRPALEALEGRVVLTVYHANNPAQLIAAVSEVNNSSGPNTIDLAPGSFFLTSALQITNASNLKIIGSTLDSGSYLFGGGSDRLLDINGGSVTLDGVTVTGGGNVAQGGGISVQNGSLTVEASTVAGNNAKTMGGGIYVQDGTLTIDRSQISQNSVSGVPDCFGGGIAAVNSQVTITRGAVNTNSATSPDTGPQGSALDMGGGIYALGGTLSIDNCTISNNRAWGITNGPGSFVSGGAIASADTVVTINVGTLVRNTISASASQTVYRPGTAFSTLGGSLTINGSALSRDALTANEQFYHVNAPVVLKNPIVGVTKQTGTFILGDNGFTTGQ